MHTHFPDKYVVELATYSEKICEDIKTGVQLVGSDRMPYEGIDNSKDKFRHLYHGHEWKSIIYNEMKQ